MIIYIIWQLSVSSNSFQCFRDCLSINGVLGFWFVASNIYIELSNYLYVSQFLFVPFFFNSFGSMSNIHPEARIYLYQYEPHPDTSLSSYSL
jgi:hypothetical protein